MSVAFNRSALACAAAAVLALPAAASGGTRTFGSDLSRVADHVEAHGADTAYWQTAGSGVGTVVPEDGQVVEVRMRGFAHSDRQPGALGGGGETMFHFQALVTRPDGTVQARSTSGAFDVPNRSAGTPDTISTFRPVNFCANAGELIAFNNIGGFGPTTYPNGTPMQVFATVPGSTVSRFTADQGTNSGAVFTPRAGHPHDQRDEVRDVELLMQMTLATGDDRTYECGGPNTYRPPDRPRKKKVYPTLARVPSKARASVNKAGVVSLPLYCSDKAGRCRGELALSAGGVDMGSGRFAIAPGKTESVRFKLSGAGRRVFGQKGGRLTATATATTKPGAAENVARARVKLKRRGA